MSLGAFAGAAGLAGAGLGGVAGFLGGQDSTREHRFRTTQFVDASIAATQRANAITEATVNSQPFRQLEGFLNQTYGGGPNPGINQLQGDMRQAQASRGLFFSPAAARNEAFATNALRFQQQQAALPALQQFIGSPERFRQSIFPQIADEEVRVATEGRGGFNTNFTPNTTSPFAGAFSGALGGATAGLNTAALFGGGQQGGAPPGPGQRFDSFNGAFF